MIHKMHKQRGDEDEDGCAGGQEGGRGVGGASWSHDTHPNSGLAVQAGGSLRGYGGMSDMNKAGLVTR